MKKVGMVASMLVAGSLSAVELPTELYNLDFTAPEVGTYETLNGTPSIQPAVGPLTDALVFDAVASYEQVRLPIGVHGPRFNIQYDVLGHNLLNSQYAFTLLLDTPQVRNVDMHGGLNVIYVFQPGFGDVTVGSLSNDQVYHFEISIDLEQNLWTVAIDGTQAFANPINASSLEAIRFSMSPTYAGTSDAPGTYAALDNVVVTVIPEPTALSLLGLGSLALVMARRRR